MMAGASASATAEVVSLTASDLRDALDECLTNIQNYGDFAVFEELPGATNPGLYLKNGGSIGLPLSDRDAEAIIAASHPAPYGKGEKTLVDNKVRKTWELSSSEFETKNPAWKDFVQMVVTKVSAKLGVDSTGKAVSAQPYKLLLYDEGAMFKPHQDSEKAPHMFATLVIALPSKHDGGEVRLTHNGKTKIFETSKFSEFSTSYLAWFADVTHEIRPVLSGRRLVLTYNLVHTTLPSTELGAGSNRAMSKLRMLLDNWRRQLDKGEKSEDELPKSLALLLDFQYTPASLSYDALKGHDRQVAAHLRSACEEGGFCFYLAHLERSIMGATDEAAGYYDDFGDDEEFHVIIEEIEREISLTTVVELSGAEVADQMDFDEDSLIPVNPFEDEEPDDEDYSGYTGNEGTSTTHFYHRTVAVILPRNRRMEFFLCPKRGGSSWRSQIYDGEGKSKLITWIERLSSDREAKPDDEAIKKDLFEVCDIVTREITKWKDEKAESWGYKRPAPYSDTDVARVIDTTLSLDSKDHFLAASAMLHEKTPPSTPGTFKAIGAGLLRYREDSHLLPMLENYLSTVPAFSTRIDVLDQFQVGLLEEMKRSGRVEKPYRDWLKRQIDLALAPPTGKSTLTSERDGIYLVTLYRKMPQQELLNRILSAVKANAKNTPMAISFLTDFVESTGKIPQDVVDSVFQAVISDITKSFDLSSLKKAMEENNKKRSYYLPTQQKHIEIDEQNGKSFAILLTLCETMRYHDELKSIIDKLVSELQTVPVELITALYFPMLKKLKVLLGEKDIAIEKSPMQELFRQVLTKYLERNVKAEPKPPTDWKQQTVDDCNCVDCQAFNQFLASPTTKVGRFTMNERRRRHLHAIMHQTTCDHELDRRGNTHTLVATKNKRAYQQDHKAWKKRCEAATKHIQELGGAELKPLLGDLYGPITALDLEELSQIQTPAIKTEPGVKVEPGIKIEDQGQSSMQTSNDSSPAPPPAKRRKPPAHRPK